MSDKGVAMIRQRLFDDMDRIEKGEEPLAIVRDPAVNECIELPIINKKGISSGMALADIENPKGPQPNSPKRFPFLAGQPAEVRAAYEDAMGFKMEAFR